MRDWTIMYSTYFALRYSTRMFRAWFPIQQFIVFPQSDCSVNENVLDIIRLQVLLDK